MTKQEWYDYLRKNSGYSQFTEDQWECCKMIFDLIGANHLYNKIKPFGYGIQYNTGEGFSTYDFSLLTNAVFLAHDRCIRLEIKSSGHGLIRICLWKRHKRDGDIFDKHPNLEQAIENYRKIFPLNEVVI